MKKQGRCFICLRKSHLAKNCPSKITSFKCSRRYHVSLRERDSQERNQTIRNAIDSTRGEIPQNTRSYQLSQTTTSGPSTLHVGSQDSILLQTAQALIGNKETNGDGMRARVIFNSWSQKSYITQRARDQLNLPTISTDSHLIKTFGTGVTDHSTECDKVKVVIKNVNKWSAREIEAFVVPIICAPIGNQEIDTAKVHSAEIELAGCNHGNEDLPIDV